MQFFLFGFYAKIFILFYFLFVNTTGEDIQQIVAAVYDVDHYVNHLHQQHIVPLLQATQDLNVFQRMLKCLLECISLIRYRGRIYERVELRCLELNTSISHESIQNHFIEDDLHLRVATFWTGRLVLDFVRLFGETSSIDE